MILETGNERTKKMKKLLLFCSAALLILVGATISFAQTVYLYVDAAPNVYGSPDYAGWESAAFNAAANGTFINMANSVDPANAGTTNFQIQDEVVYSFGDLGKRLTWIYWIPNETIANLKGNFKIGLENVWDGITEDFYNDYYGSTWLEPTKWISYQGGVIGTAGMAWWGAYNTNTQAELDADLANWGAVAEEWTFSAQLDGATVSLTSQRSPVPEPSTILLLGFGLIGIAGVARKRIRS
jgi:hypothetical protein